MEKANATCQPDRSREASGDQADQGQLLAQQSYRDHHACLFHSRQGGGTGVLVSYFCVTHLGKLGILLPLHYHIPGTTFENVVCTFHGSVE